MPRSQRGGLGVGRGGGGGRMCAGLVERRLGVEGGEAEGVARGDGWRKEGGGGGGTDGEGGGGPLV